MMNNTDLMKLISSYIHTILTLIGTLITFLRSPFIRISNLVLDLYFRHGCNLTPLTIDITPTTQIHLYTATHRRHSKPNLILLHGFGGDARWQFYPLIRPLSRLFNLYIPDLLFFGDSFTLDPDRSLENQARCVMEAVRRLGLVGGGEEEKCAVFGISYGGWVAYRMAEMYGPEVVAKVVIVSSGVGYTEEQRIQHFKSLGDVRIQELLIPEKAADLRRLVDMVAYRHQFHWVPDFFLQEFVDVMHENYKEQRRELVEHMLKQKSDSEHLPIIKQKTLLIWGDQDKIFPLYLGHQLQRHLSPNAKLEVIKDCGHAANMDAPSELTRFITSFVLDT